MQENSQARKSVKYFSLQEANAMLPLVKSIVADVCEVFEHVTARRSDLHRLLRQRSSTGVDAQYADEMAESREDLREEYEAIWKYREELESLGVNLRQPDKGCIEFRTQIDGSECFLCWQLGQDAIEYYRDASSPDSPWKRLPSFQVN